MLRNQKISQYRERLDQTLASHDLMDERMLTDLVKNQLLHSMPDGDEGHIEDVLGERTLELSRFLDMLRSASLPEDMYKSHSKQHAGWKLKQDTEDCRIMYREGLNGSPFHTLLVEGYIDAPMDICLCVSWESDLYKKWWPQYNFPTFKIISCKCMHRVQAREQTSSVRMKLPWPLSDREAVVNYFEFPYFQDDLIIVIINSVPDLETSDSKFGGLSDYGTAEGMDIIKIGIIGGFALQRVSSERSYFRTLFNMDLKMDFVPPTLNNFMSRQLVGNGFRLYQKAVASVSKGDEDFSRALSDPMYTQIRESYHSSNAEMRMLKPEGPKSLVACIPNEQLIDTAQANAEISSNMAHNDQSASGSCGPVIDQKSFAVIEEEDIGKETGQLEQNSIYNDHYVPQRIGENWYLRRDRKVLIRPAVVQGLDKLEKIISLIQNAGFSAQTGDPKVDKLSVEKMSKSSGFIDGGIKNEACDNLSVDNASKELDPDFYKSRPKGLNPSMGEVNQNRVAPILKETADEKEQITMGPEVHGRRKVRQNKKQGTCCLCFMPNKPLTSHE